ncbi:MAG TPA: GNAT family N-acetyltransferase [Acidimicrobiales bacterium]|nr:GNAT family N-acetyltransferase [Acidimicrobiales bacterium]
MSGNVKVFRADQSRLSDLAELRYRWRSEEGGEEGGGIEDFAARFRSWYADHTTSHLGYLLTVDDVPVGCAWLVVIDRIPGPEIFERRAGMVQSVFLLPKYRSQGLGVSLMRQLIEDARSMGLSYLLMHPSKESFSFYQRLGFENAQRALELRFDLTK